MLASTDITQNTLFIYKKIKQKVSQNNLQCVKSFKTTYMKLPNLLIYQMAESIFVYINMSIFVCSIDILQLFAVFKY